ncbi:MAG: hypothetical protein ACJ76X_19155 [Solirubrobacteraceae bacterium]
MFDSEVLELCRDCLLDAITVCSSEDDLSLVATALSGDLRDMHLFIARDLLAAAARGAVSVLDASDLGAKAFAAALSRLAWLQRRTRLGLPAPVSTGV